jgi:hypothetical protein
MDTFSQPIRLSNPRECLYLSQISPDGESHRRAIAEPFMQWPVTVKKLEERFVP